MHSVRSRSVAALAVGYLLLIACSGEAPPAAGGAGASAGAPSGNAGAGGSRAPGTSGSTAAGATAATGAGTGGMIAAAAGRAATAGMDAAGTASPQPDATTVDPDTQPLIPDPSWHCNLPGGIPVPDSGELVFEAELQTGPVLEIGATQYGARRVIPIMGGTVEGPRINGRFLDGGLEWELTPADGKVEVEARNVIRADDGRLIYMRTCGAGAPGASVRIVPDFEAPSSSDYAFLHGRTLVGTRALGQGSMTLRVYEVAATAPPPTPAQLGPNDQPWECPAPTGPVGSTPVLQAAVNIGASLAVGSSKYGSRNIIPITGGTFTGTDVEGDVVSGGADYQLTPSGGGDLLIEARYTLKTSDGELIVVRNCNGGTGEGTRLSFETRKDGPYAWINADGFTGTIGLRLGGVLISVFK
jgi:Protein of unknown function (DUF3237)